MARIGLALVALLAVALIPVNPPVAVPGWDAAPMTPGWHNLFTAWERWDALWFLRIATVGYSTADVSAAFFPLYPMLIKVLSTLIGGHPLAAALIISNAAYLAAMTVVYRLTSFEFDDHTARRTVLYMTLFPTAFFFFAPYTESLFLLWAASAIYAARKRGWWVAAACGALASATRSIGLVLVPVLAVEAIRQYVSAPREERSIATLAGSLAASAAASLGMLAYFASWQLRDGEFLRPLTNQGGWQREFSWPWNTIRDAGKQAIDYIGSYPGGYHTVDVLLFVVALACCIWLLRRASITYGVYVALSLLAPLLLVFGGRQLMSMTRFILPMFPIFWALARFADRYKAHEAVVGLSAAGLGLMTALFATWYFVF